MANDFGALTDHFSILTVTHNTTGTMDDILELVDSSKTPVAMSRGDAIDENQDVAAATWYGNTSGTLYEASSTFALVSGTLPMAELDIGELTAGSIVASYEITTSNGGWPQLTFTGRLGCQTVVAPTGLLNTFSIPAITITAIKQAQLIGFTVDAACRITGSSFSAACDIAQQDDGVGEPAAHGVSGCIATVTAELVRVTGACAWTPTFSGLTETQAPGASEGQAAYHTASVAAELVIARDASA